MSGGEVRALGIFLSALLFLACSSDDGGDAKGTGGTSGGGSGGAGTGGGSSGGASSGGASSGGSAGSSTGGAPGDSGSDGPACKTSTSGSGNNVDTTALCKKVVAAGCGNVTQSDCESVFATFPIQCPEAYNAFIDCAGATPDFACDGNTPTSKTCVDEWAACMKPCLPTK